MLACSWCSDTFLTDFIESIDADVPLIVIFSGDFVIEELIIDLRVIEACFAAGVPTTPTDGMINQMS